MLREIIISTASGRTRVAVIENHVPVEVYFEPPGAELVGSIYKGKVENVLPGIEAAFVNIGLEKNAFLHVHDARAVADGQGRKLGIEELLRPGQEVVVQVVKGPFKTKGPRVTTHVTIPGRYLVLAPMVQHTGVSRRIGLPSERERLRQLVAKLCPPGMGLIVRTAAEGVGEAELEHDLVNLLKLWDEIRAKAREPGPRLLFRDVELLPRILRDFFTADVARLVVDSPALQVQVLEILDEMEPGLKDRVYLETGRNLMEVYGVEQEVKRALKRRVWLKCGGYIVFDQAEALTVIDVNTGKYVGSQSLEETVVKANIEAAQEIARQLRLRNIGGIIIIDFIDMLEEKHRQEVLDALEEALRQDRVRFHILGITKLGLVELTRKKIYPSLAEMLLKPCPRCEGTGRVQVDKGDSFH
ncbi:MAG: Rne/Rng family ribonuclease [Bacillota bacterium]|nr:Rne/Rng family ribonuclease [Thermoanaerobacteraceae bacterium]